MKRLAFALAALSRVAGATSCKEACMSERGYRKQVLDSCLYEAAKAPPESQGKVRLECRRRSVLPDCDGLPPCANGERAISGIEIVSHAFSATGDGAPLREVVFQPGDTVFLRYQGVVMPDPGASEMKLKAQCALLSGKKALQHRADDLGPPRRLKDHAPQPFTGRTSLALPTSLEPGEYVVELRLRDSGSRLDLVRGFRLRVEKPRSP